MEGFVSPVNIGSTRAFKKCRECRGQKVKCLPIYRDWPEKCERCQRLSLPCGPNVTHKEAQAAQIAGVRAGQGTLLEDEYEMPDMASPSFQQLNELPIRHPETTNSLDEYLEQRSGSEPRPQPFQFSDSYSIRSPNSTPGTTVTAPLVESCGMSIFSRDRCEGPLRKRLRELDLNTAFFLYVKWTMQFLQTLGLQEQNPYGTLNFLRISLENHIGAKIVEIQTLADQADHNGESFQAETAYRRVADTLDYLGNPGRYNTNSFLKNFALFYERNNDTIQAERVLKRLSNLSLTTTERQDYCKMVTEFFLKASDQISKGIECLNIRGTTLNLETPCPAFQRAVQHEMPEDVLDAISEISNLPDIIQQGNIHVAVEAGLVRQVEKHLKSISSASINARDAFSRTSLYVAAQMGHVSESLALIGAGADRSTRDARGHTALEVAARTGATPIVSALISDELRGGIAADVNSYVTYNGSTPLQAASEEGHMEVVEVLVDHGAFVSAIRQHDGSTAAQLARMRGHPDIAEYLDRFSAGEAFDPTLLETIDLYGLAD